MEKMNTTLRDILLESRKNLQQIKTLPKLAEIHNKQEAIETMLAVAKSSTLGKQQGWKIAATNSKMQQRLKTNEPVFGATFINNYYSSPALFTTNELLDPIVECEFVFKIKNDLTNKATPYTFKEIEEHIVAVYLCVEVAECRFHNQHLPNTLYLMADGFAAGQYVLGKELKNWKKCFASGVKVNLFRNREWHSSGSSNDVMGHPLNPVVWLANTLIKYGHYLKKGDLVSSGSCNILAKAQAGDHFIAEYDDLGKIELQFK